MTLKPKYSWRQTTAKLIIVISLHKTPIKEVEVISSPSYLKVTFPRYCLEQFFLHSVDDDCTVTRSSTKELEVILTKSTAIEWQTLEREISKQDAAAERKEAMEFHYQKIQQRNSELKERLVLQNKECISKQLQFEEDKEKLMKNKREQTIKSFFDDEQDLAQHSATTILPNTGNRRVSEDREYDGDEEDHYSSCDEFSKMMITEVGQPSGRKQFRSSNPRRSTCPVINSDEEMTSKGSTSSQRHSSKKNVKKNSNLRNEVRATKSISVTYSSRPISQTARDSHVYCTEEGVTVETGKVDVDVLFDQAKKSFEDGLFAESVGAYSKVLEVLPDCTKALSNRAAAHLASDNPTLALADSNKALSLMKTQGQSDTQSRLLLLIRRGTAHSKICHYNEALSDYEEALRLDPSNKDLERDCCNLRKAIVSSDGSSWAETEEECTALHRTY